MPENKMLGKAEFENQLTALGDDQLGLIKFVARQQFDAAEVQVDHGKRIKSLESKNKKLMGAIGGTGAIIATAVTAFIDYVMKRPG